MSTSGSSISRLAVKAMGLFGGSQAVTIFCSIVRTKLVAIWIGANGVGLFGIFNQALELINTGTNLGMRQSSVRDISKACGSHDISRVARVVAVVRKWSVWLGLLGAFLTLAFSPLLSEATFHDTNHAWHYMLLSVAVLLTTLTNGENAVLQGTSRLSRLAAVSIWGTSAGLLISIPLFYFLREDSILPSILAYAASCAVAAYVLRNKDFSGTKVPRREAFDMGKSFVMLGIFMTVGAFATTLASNVFIAWLNNYGGTEQVGYYQAGYTLVNKYTGLILAALGMEYYPRLARVAHSQQRLRVFVTQEVNITMIVVTPIVALFILFRNEIITLLYAPEFTVMVPLVTWGIMGTIMRTLSWSLAFVILAKGAGGIYLITEALSAAVGLALNIVFYIQWGLLGLGLSFLAWYVAYTIIVGYVYWRVFRLSLSKGSLVNTLWAIVVALAMIWAMDSGNTLIAITIAVFSVALSGVMMWKMLGLGRRKLRSGEKSEG